MPSKAMTMETPIVVRNECLLMAYLQSAGTSRMDGYIPEHALPHSGKTISMDKIVRDAHCDINVILHPGRAD